MHITDFYLVMKTFKIYPPNNVQICNIVLLTMLIMLYEVLF